MMKMQEDIYETPQERDVRKISRLEPRLPYYRLAQSRIKDYIRDNSLRPGDALPAEQKISDQLGISRNSVREATRALESVGILETRQGSGLFVRAFSFDVLLELLPYGMLTDLRQLEQVLRVREALEFGMFETALQAFPETQLARLRTIVDEMHFRAARGQSFPEEDRAFHNTLFEHLGNDFLNTLQSVFWNAFNRASVQFDLRNPNPRKTAEEHAKIVQAIASGDVLIAREALRKHYESIETRIRRLQVSMLTQTERSKSGKSAQTAAT